jgi:hypothetical protein
LEECAFLGVGVCAFMDNFNSQANMKILEEGYLQFTKDRLVNGQVHRYIYAFYWI